MVQEGFKRKLTAILSADAEGYSSLMGDDEEATVRTLTAYREVHTTLIQQHNGQVLDSPGDNLLAEFVSVVDAVQCAVAVQKEIKARNYQLPENRRMQFRIGINLGDVIQEEERIYGDGVNIAARLESLANPGGICISKTAFDQIESKLPYGYEFLGDQTVKNIAKPVSAYRVIMEPRVTVAGKPVDKKPAALRRMPILVGAVAVFVLAIAVGIWQFYARRPSVEPASVQKMALPLPEKPSIAVLPFVNIGGDPEQEYFSDGIIEDIITDLSKMSGLFVISRSSTFAYKGKPVKIKQVSEEFGVRYVLEGSVRKGSDKVRINAQLIDAITGHHLWAERYDRDLKNIFALQDEITQKIVRTLRVEVEEAELKHIRRTPTENLNAYESALRGSAELKHHRKSTNAQARQMFERAIELDPEYARPYVSLGWTYFFDWVNYWGQDFRQALERALELAQKAIELDDSYADAYMLLSVVYLYKDRQYEQAIAVAEKAIALDRSNAKGYSVLAAILNAAGRPEEVIRLLEQAMRLNPRYPADYLFHSGRAHYYMEQYDKAIEVLKRAVTRRPNHTFTHLYLAASYVQIDREKEARSEVAEALRISPNIRIEVGWMFYKDQAVEERFNNSLRRAGLK
jgi:adenylate cyclase